MKKLQFLSYLFAALFMVTMVSCDDDDDDTTNPNPDKETLLTAKVWNGSKVYYQNADFTEQVKELFDISTTTIKFNADGTYTASMSGEDDETGTWEFASNDTKIVMDSESSDPITVDINTLTATELWVEGDFLETGGQETIELRFVH
ncbi:hypothetical protein H7F15_13295 [Pontibacter sp. Tf4]|uniref:hypothetical protein n=1 Tax=Pontibacter sp. Tf4 TaxID=2761620 RepID=UPI0016261C08|nr:hypothetical protein [Pontibacter sp. Tf4]MBB6612019.1 hypothetical protein [Pontibacter sp. Tf4]